MEYIKLAPRNGYSCPSYYLLRNGDIVKRTSEKAFHILKSSDEDKEGNYIYFDAKLKHISGNHFEKNQKYDIVSEVKLLPDRICEIESNVKPGMEFEYLGDNPRLTKGYTYTIETVKMYLDGSYCIEFYNDRDQISCIYDLTEIILRGEPDYKI